VPVNVGLAIGAYVLAAVVAASAPVILESLPAAAVVPVVPYAAEIVPLATLSPVPTMTPPSVDVVALGSV
jgi:hypothetical protein